jgi:hypothetical protein
MSLLPKKTLVFQYGAAAYPRSRLDKVMKDNTYRSVQVGDDAFFQRHDSFGLADGVGTGWDLVQGNLTTFFSFSNLNHQHVTRST